GNDLAEAGQGAGARGEGHTGAAAPGELEHPDRGRGAGGMAGAERLRELAAPRVRAERERRAAVLASAPGAGVAAVGAAPALPECLRQEAARLGTVRLVARFLGLHAA